MRRIFFLIPLLCSLALAAQTDSVNYVQGFQFNEGIYFNFSQFRNNKPLRKRDLISDEDSTRLDYIKLILSKEVFQYRDSAGKIQTAKVTSIWGYSENKGVYVRFNAQFNRIVVIGSLCHFTSYYTDYRYTGPGTYPGAQYGTPVESLRQYVLDTQTGTIYDFSVAAMEYFLARDPALSAEYAALKKKQKREQMFIFLRRYNEKHVLKFPL